MRIDGRRQRHPRLVLRRRALPRCRSGRSRTAASWPRRGPTILDVGGESTRPGAEAVGAPRSWRGSSRWSRRCRAAGAPISIDTSKLAVAEAALDAGAAIVNDVTALRGDPEMAALCAERGAGVVLMHMLGTPRTMQETRPTTTSSTTSGPSSPSGSRSAIAAGVAEERIWIDPGIGFGKTLEHNLELLRAARRARATSGGRSSSAPRARASSARSTAPRSASGSAARSPPRSLAAANGAEVLRVHDVAEMPRRCGWRRRSSDGRALRAT